MNPYQVLELILETLADGRKEGESIADYKVRKASELEKLYNDKEDKATMVADNASKRANKEKGKFKKTKNLKNLKNALDLGSYALDKRMEASDASRKGTKASIIKYSTKRRNEMSEALEIAEAIINEVSTKLWKKAAANSLDKREEAAKNAAKAAEQSWDEYEEGSRKSPEDEPALYRRAWKNDLFAKKAEDREEHAHDVLAVKSNAKSANKAIKAAKKVSVKREDAFGANPTAKTLNRSNKANNLVYADPKYKNEALEIMEEILNVIESSKEELVNKYVPNIKAERRHLDKEVKKGKALAKGLEKSANFSGEMKEKAQQDYDKAQDKEWGAQYDVTRTEYGTPEHNVARIRYNKARQELKGADKELKDWTRDEYVTREKAGSVKKEAKEANKKRNDLNKKIAALKGRSDVVTNKAFEALSLMEQICDFADNLFELDYEQKQNIHPNKISRTKKDENGEKVEVVSVADELFPYEGNAKEQFNKKVLDKINAMIEGSGSLEDLIQFVRSGVKGKVHESLDEAVELLEEILNPDEPKRERKNNKQQVYRRMDDPEKGEIGVKKNYNRVIHNDSVNKDSAFDYVKIKGTKYRVDKHGEIGAPIQEEKKEPNAECEYRKGEWDKAVQNYYDTKKKNMDFEGKHPETKAAYDEERKAYANLDKARRDSKKINGPYEALEEIKNIAEGLFKKDERGDLLDDIDTALGSPVKKKIKDIENRMTGCKEKGVNEASDLI